MDSPLLSPEEPALPRPWFYPRKTHFGFLASRIIIHLELIRIEAVVWMARFLSVLELKQLISLTPTPLCYMLQLNVRTWAKVNADQEEVTVAEPWYISGRIVEHRIEHFYAPLLNPQLLLEMFRGILKWFNDMLHVKSLAQCLIQSKCSINNSNVEFNDDSNYWHADRGLCLCLNKLDSPNNLPPSGRR